MAQIFFSVGNRQSAAPPARKSYLVVFVLLVILAINYGPSLLRPRAMPTILTATPTRLPARRTPTPFPIIVSNDKWRPIAQRYNGVVMVKVPPGCFKMGSDSAGERDERPTTEICFDQPFWIDRTEVTNGQFTRLSGKAVNPNPWKGNDRPRASITWFEARDYCAKRGARLPTEAEWEYAARGPDNLEYPWGNWLILSYAVYHGNSTGDIANVGSKPRGASWVGALDMSGNAWEWVSSLYQPYPYDAEDGREDNSNTNSPRVLRGGLWAYGDTDIRSAVRDPYSPFLNNVGIGVRCARSQ